MVSTFFRLLLPTACILAFWSCQTHNDGTIEGTVVPPAPGARITASRPGQPVRAADADPADGTFRISLAAGRYDVAVFIPAYPYPIHFSDISVDPGKSTTLPPIETVRRSGNAALGGTVYPASDGTIIRLEYEGRELANVQTVGDGHYEFKGLPSGNYVIRVTSPGYASDAVNISLPEGKRLSRNVRLLLITALDGIDWNNGVIRAVGKGRYPTNAATPAVKHELARRAALSDAERNLLKCIQGIKLDKNHDLKSLMNSGKFADHIRGFLKGFRVINERDLGDELEIELELPLTGPAGLTRYLEE